MTGSPLDVLREALDDLDQRTGTLRTAPGRSALAQVETLVEAAREVLPGDPYGSMWRPLIDALAPFGEGVA